MKNDDVAGTAVDRRRFLGSAALGAAGVALGSTACAGPDGGGSAAVQTRPSVQWRLASSFPRSLDTLYGTAERLATLLEQLTEGRFMIRSYAAGEIVPPLQVLDAAQQGTVQVGHSPGYYYMGKNEALAFDTGVPFGLTARQQDAWLYEGGGLDLMRGVYSDFGIINFPGGNTGAQMGGWFKREIGSLAELRGMKMRIPAMGGAVMNRLGVTVQVLGGGEIYPALERGAIDATEWVGPHDDEKLGFQNAARFYYYPGWWEPGPSMSFMVNRQAWDALPSSYQQAFEIAARAAAASTLIMYDKLNPEALERLVAGGTQLRRYPDDVMRQAEVTPAELLEERASRDARFRTILSAYRAFREDSYRWFGTSEQAFAAYAFGRADG